MKAAVCRARCGSVRAPRTVSQKPSPELPSTHVDSGPLIFCGSVGQGAVPKPRRVARIELRQCRTLFLLVAVTDQSFFPDSNLLKLRGARQQELHERAASIALESFGRRVFVRAVVEVSNYCRENCSYCGMRRDNRELSRYRARLEQMAELLVHHRPESVTDINIQTGEDPVIVREVVLPLIRILRSETTLGVSVCLGTLNPALYRDLQSAGASIYILKFEMADSANYAAMRAPGTHAERIDHIHRLASSGWNVSSGFIAGLPGQDDAALLESFGLARALPLAGCSVSPFIPGDHTPLAGSATADLDLTLNCMAALRLMRPDWVIPSVSALNLAGPRGGYRRGLRTGANLVTINLTPPDFRGDYVLYKRDRYIMTEDRILAAIQAEKLIPARQGLAEYYRSRAQTGASRRPSGVAITAA